MHDAVSIDGGRRPLFVPVFSPEPDLGVAFVHAVLETDSASGDVEFEEYRLTLEHLPADAFDSAESQECLARADAMAMIVHFLDGPSLEAARRLYHRTRAVRAVPFGVFILRPAEERQFKISCPECGQKLWIQEQEIGMRGRCINCRRPMSIPPPSEYLRIRLLLPDAVPVLNVIGGDTSLCRGALANLLARTGPGIYESGQPADFLKQATVPIQVPADALPRK